MWPRSARSVLLLLAAAVAAGLTPAAAAAEFNRDDATPGRRVWSVHLDNDLFAFTDKDRDYTGGVTFSLTGEDARVHPLSFDRALGWADRRSGFGRLTNRAEPAGHALDVGLLLFTPQDLASSVPVADDRPYASLAFVSTSRLAHDPRRGVVYQSGLTFGALGLPLAGTLHRGVHEAFGSVRPSGYEHQISAGGEPTFRYAAARQELLASGTYADRPYSVRLGSALSVGYVTEVSAEIGARWGRTRWPWWSSVPASADYAGLPPIGVTESFSSARRIQVLFDAGIKARVRLYNAFLQGQFRNSDVEFGSSDVRHLLVEAWLGVTAVLNDRLSVSYTVRRQTEELKVGRGAREFTWASIGVAQQF